MAEETSNISVFDVSAGLRERGWQVPAYTFPPDREDLEVLRFVVRNGFSKELADLLIQDLGHLLQRLRRQTQSMRGSEEASFDHTGAQSPQED
jgi:glutamate decarboxylase